MTQVEKEVSMFTTEIVSSQITDTRVCSEFKMCRTSIAPKIHVDGNFLKKTVYNVKFTEEICPLLLIYKKYFQFQEISFNYA